MFIYSDPTIQMPATQELPDGDTWIIESWFKYVRPNGQEIFVPPSGLGDVDSMLLNPVWTTDYGSIPQFAQAIFRKYGRCAGAYVVHDWMYSCELFDRATCDWILLEMLQELGSNWFSRNTIYSAVRLGGGVVWGKHDPKTVAFLKNYGAIFQNSVKV